MDHKKYLTTGQAAKLCSVTSDTMLKWIKQGRIPASRTAGGHYRISKQDLDRLKVVPLDQAPPRKKERLFQYCWEYNAEQGLPVDECQDCIVYRMRAYRCYEVLRLAPSGGHSQHFCKQSCDECDYYMRVHKQPTNVLVVSDNEVLTTALTRDASIAPMNLEAVDCEYACSALVDSFRPDYVIVDCSLGTERSRDFVFHLKEDPRVPYVRIILAAGKNEFPKGCDKEVFARMETPFSLDDITDCISGLRPREITKIENPGSELGSKKTKVGD